MATTIAKKAVNTEKVAQALERAYREGDYSRVGSFFCG
jgi:hypothetical protein